MKTDMDRLRGKIAERRITQEELAAKIGINASTLSRKMMSNGLSFTVSQMHKIVAELSLSDEDAKQIFLQQNSQ